MFMDNRLTVDLDLFNPGRELLHIQLLIQMNHAVQDQLHRLALEEICIVQSHFPGLEPWFVFVSVNLRAGASHFEECRGNGGGQMPGSIDLAVDHQVRVPFWNALRDTPLSMMTVPLMNTRSGRSKS